MSTTGISAGETSIYTALICRNLCSFKTKQKTSKKPTKENLSGSWLGPCGFEICAVPWVLAAYFGAGSHREEQELCIGCTPSLGSGGSVGWGAAVSSQLCGAGTAAHLISWKIKSHNLHSGKPPMQLSRFSLVQEKGVKAQLPGSTKRETCLYFFFFFLPFP